MTFEIEYETDIKLSFDYKKVIEDTIMAALDYEKCPYEACVNVILTDNEAIHETNLAMRQIDRETDVLSFPMCEYDHPADFDPLEEQDDCFHPETGELLLGDIMISVERVISQAEEYGHSQIRELAFLIAHSCLHLMGYDHMEDDERIEMERRQEAILNSIGITRDCENY